MMIQAASRLGWTAFAVAFGSTASPTRLGTQPQPGGRHRTQPHFSADPADGGATPHASPATSSTLSTHSGRIRTGEVGQNGSSLGSERTAAFDYSSLQSRHSAFGRGCVGTRGGSPSGVLRRIAG